MSARRRDERGAIAALTALTLSLVIAAAAFAVDLGMQRVVRSDMQALADAAALDAARLLDGRTAGQVRAGSGSQPSLASVVAASVARNTDSTLGDVGDVTGVLVTLTPGTHGELVPLRAGETVVEVPDGDVPDAVMVTAAGAVDFAFAPGSGGATRSALADASPFACFRLGSYAAALSSGDSAVAGVFESMVSDVLGLELKAAGYQGLLTSYIGIGALAGELGVGSPEELAALTSLSAGSLLSAGARALTRQGDTAAGADLQALAAKVDNGIVVNVADFLSVGDQAAMQGSINAVDLLGSATLGAAAVLANSNNFLDTGVAWSAPHVSGGNVELRAIQVPQQGCGPPGSTTARTAQVELTADIGFTLPNKLAGLDVSIQDDKTTKQATLSARATLAGATGTLTGITCGEGTVAEPEELRVRVDSQLLSTSVTLPFRMHGEVAPTGIVPSGVLGALPIGATVTVELDLQMSVRAASYSAPRTALADTAYRVPPRTYQDVEPSEGAGDPVALPAASVVVDEAASTAKLKIQTKLLGVTTTTTQDLSLSGLNLGSITSAALASTLGTSTAAVTNNLNAALSPVSTLLGIRVNGADLIGIPRPNCSQPALVG